MTRSAPFLYKDAPPRATIARIRRILEGLDLLVSEDAWFQWGEHLHSVRLGLDRSGLGVNGKGLSVEAALASGYAELMERLQNQLLHRFDYYLVRALRRLRGGTDFLHAPDESVIPVSDYLASLDARWLRAFAPCDMRGDDHAQWLEPLAEDGKLVCLPYVDLVSRATVFLPTRLVRFLYGSNGMCAGNTEREALVQGMSEIAERHALDVIYHDGVIPPEMNRACLAESPLLASVAQTLETEFGFRLSIRDCSLGIGLPVAAVIVHDIANAGYRVAFGAHPNLDEAIARCFTEVFQGIPRGVTTPLATVNLHRSEFDSRPGSTNFKNIRFCGRGAFPSALLYREPSYPQALTIGPLRLATAGAFDHLRDLLHGLTGGPILVRDVSFFGFPSFQVVVPGMASRRYPGEELHLHLKVAEVSDLLIDLDRRSPSDLRRVRDVLDHVTRLQTLVENSLTSLSWIPLGPRSQWTGLGLDVVLFLLNAALDDWDAAIATLDAAATRLGAQNTNDRASDVSLVATRDFLVLTRREGLSASSATLILERCYGPTIAASVARLWAENARPLDMLGLPRCFRCDECTLAQGCDFPLWERLHAALRDAMRTSPTARQTPGDRR